MTSIMMRNFSSVASALVAASLLAGCAGGGNATGGGAAFAPAVPTPSASGGAQSFTSFTWGQQQLAKAQYVSPVTTGHMSMSVAVRMKSEAGLLSYARDASDPKSSSYREFLTPQEIGERFGATSADYRATAAYFTSYGISVGGWPQHLQLSLAGGVPQFEKAFGTTFATYREAGKTFVGPVGTPHLARAVPITAVLNLAALPIVRNYLLRGSSSLFGGYSPQVLAKIFDYSGASSVGLNGSGITIGIVGTGPISSADVPNLGTTFDAPVANVVQMPVHAQAATEQNNGTGTLPYDPNPGGLTVPPPVTGPCYATSPANYTVCNPEDIEAQLDTESTASLAPRATVDFYFAYNPSECYNPNTGVFTAPPCADGFATYPLIGIDIADDEIQQAIADDAVDDLSLSYGGGENEALGYYFDAAGNGIGPSEFAALAAEGIAVFVSSGDTGNQSCFDPNTGLPLTTPCVSYPASDPSVTAVGGVNAPANDAGNLVGTIAAWADQTSGGGNGSFGNNVGSGGGVSQYFATPPWQSAITLPADADPPSPQLGGKRGVPDVSLDADPGTGPAVVANVAFGGHRLEEAVGGTSAAAPEMAAMWALVLQACRETATCATASGAHPYRLGNAAPIVYAIYRNKTGASPAPAGGGFAPELTYGQTFFDVLYGENQANTSGYPTIGPAITGCCTAGPGYDLVTGVGVPFGGHLVRAITGLKAP
jgi:subtilase family serine protease